MEDLQINDISNETGNIGQNQSTDSLFQPSNSNAGNLDLTFIDTAMTPLASSTTEPEESSTPSGYRVVKGSEAYAGFGRAAGGDGGSSGGGDGGSSGGDSSSSSSSTSTSNASASDVSATFTAAVDAQYGAGGWNSAYSSLGKDNNSNNNNNNSGSSSGSSGNSGGTSADAQQSAAAAEASANTAAATGDTSGGGSAVAGAQAGVDSANASINAAHDAAQAAVTAMQEANSVTVDAKGKAAAAAQQAAAAETIAQAYAETVNECQADVNNAKASLENSKNVTSVTDGDNNSATITISETNSMATGGKYTFNYTVTMDEEGHVNVTNDNNGKTSYYDSPEDAAMGLGSVGKEAVEALEQYVDSKGQLDYQQSLADKAANLADKARQEAEDARGKYEAAKQAEQEAINNAADAVGKYQESINNGNTAMDAYNEAVGKAAAEAEAAKEAAAKDNESDNEGPGPSSSPAQQQQAVEDIKDATEGRDNEAWRDTTIGEVVTAYQDLISEFDDDTSTVSLISEFWNAFMDELSFISKDEDMGVIGKIQSIYDAAKAFVSRVYQACKESHVGHIVTAVSKTLKLALIAGATVLTGGLAGGLAVMHDIVELTYNGFKGKYGRGGDSSPTGVTSTPEEETLYRDVFATLDNEFSGLTDELNKGYTSSNRTKNYSDYNYGLEGKQKGQLYSDEEIKSFINTVVRKSPVKYIPKFD